MLLLICIFRSIHISILKYFSLNISFDLSRCLCNESNRLNCQLSTLHLILFPSQLAVVTTSGNEATEALYLSHASNVSNISNILSEQIMSKELSGDTTEFKELVTKELKKMEIAEQKEKQQELEKMRLVAREKAARLWHEQKEIEQAKAEAEQKKQEQLEVGSRKEKAKGNRTGR